MQINILLITQSSVLDVSVFTSPVCTVCCTSIFTKENAYICGHKPSFTTRQALFARLWWNILLLLKQRRLILWNSCSNQGHRQSTDKGNRMRNRFGDVYAKTIRGNNISWMYCTVVRGGNGGWVKELGKVVQSHCLPLFLNSGRGVSVSSHVDIIMEKIAKYLFVTCLLVRKLVTVRYSNVICLCLFLTSESRDKSQNLQNIPNYICKYRSSFTICRIISILV